MLMKAMISGATMLTRNIDKALSVSVATRHDVWLSVIFLDCELGNFDGHHRA